MFLISFGYDEYQDGTESADTLADAVEIAQYTRNLSDDEAAELRLNLYLSRVDAIGGEEWISIEPVGVMVAA